jgi:hypothetical protein
VKYYASGWKTFGTTSGGKVTKELLPGSYSFRMKYEGYTQQKSNVDITNPSNNPLIFQTLLMEVQLQNSSNALMDVGQVKYYASGWKTFGTTSGGKVTKELLPGSYSFRMKYEGYTQQKSSVDITNPINNPLVFQTLNMVVSLQTCDPVAGLPDGEVKYYASGWKMFGTTDATGNASKELLPGTYSFRMKYIGQTNQESNVNITTTNPLVFTTTTVTLSNAGTIKYYASGWKTFTSPLELLPHNYPFRFYSNGTMILQQNINVLGCAYSAGMLTVLDENGNGVPGVKFKPACGGSWKPILPGVTDNGGHLFAEIPACMTKIRASKDNSSKELSKAALEASDYTYETQVLRINLIDHAGVPITDQTGSLEQGGGTWVNLGNFNASGYVDVQTFPTGSGKYEVGYNCTSEQKSGINVVEGAGIQEVDFQTGQVFGDCITQYQGCGWSTFTSGMELMPGTRDYRYPLNDNVTITAGSITYLTCPDNIPGGVIPDEKDVAVKGEPTIYPNPVDGPLTIQYVVHKTSSVQVVLYNTMGVHVKELVNATQEENGYKFELDTDHLMPGTYYLRFMIDDQLYVKPVIIQ